MAVDDRRHLTSRSLHVSTWRGQDRTVLLNPSPDRPAPDVAAIARALERLRLDGQERVLTGALHQHEVEPFLQVGFTVHERLHLLRHDLHDIDDLPPTPAPSIRRAWRRDRPGILAVDTLAFDDFWKLDDRGLDDAIHATPTARVRVVGRAGGTDGTIRAYAVTGRAGDRGYLQRLAVHPHEQRHGIATALVADALRWLVRRGVSQALVNTQERNTGAYALYVHCGFVPEPTGLTVLTYDLSPSRPAGGPTGAS